LERRLRRKRTIGGRRKLRRTSFDGKSTGRTRRSSRSSSRFEKRSSTLRGRGNRNNGVGIGARSGFGG
jgi:hypothetical protein